MTDERDSAGTVELPAEPPAIDRSFLDDAIAVREAVGFVAVGGRDDADLRYLTRFEGPEDDYAYVRTPEADVLCAPAGHVARANREFDGRVASDRPGDRPGERAAAVLDEVSGAESTDAPGAERSAPQTVLVPPSIPHDAAVSLERAGYELRSTTAVADARATKTEGEIEAIRAVQRAAVVGIRRAECVLAAAEADAEGRLRSGDAPLTDERLRREVNAELARCGVAGAENTKILAGASADSARNPSVLSTDESIRIDVAPRGPHGYHGFRSRTVVVDSDGGWERRAYVAVEAALEAALDEVEAGADAADVRREADAELAAFGFDPTGGAGTHADDGCDPIETGHGVGLSRRERPFLRANETLEAGAVLAIAPGLIDPERGSVRLGDLVIVTETGHELLVEGTRSFTPRE